MADKFLAKVSQNLLDTFGNNLSQVTVVIPGKRARLFMNQYLAQQSDKPVWAPRYQTIDELFLELSHFKKAEQIETVCLLYKIYSQLTDNPQPLDEFYSWGEIILSDFDDIDKHMAPANKIFANVYDLHAIESDYLTPEQETALKEFFDNFSIEKNTELKRRFLQLWEIMPKLYEGLREKLMERGYLYSGALYREVVERYRKAGETELEKLAEMQKRTYAFVGFNVVDECEEALFRLLGEEHTRFYWDYDEMYINDVHFKAQLDKSSNKPGNYLGTTWEAGLFLRQNLKSFPNRLPRENFDNLRHLKDITFIATSTDNAQARYIPEWISQQLTTPENETAIVLCDEHMLLPVLHSLPEEEPKQINVTMGFPLTDTPIYSFLSVLMSMQIDGWDHSARRFRHSFMEKVKHHPYYKVMMECSGMEKGMSNNPITGEHMSHEWLFEHQSSNTGLLQYLQKVIQILGEYYAMKMKLRKQAEETQQEGSSATIDLTEGDVKPMEVDVYDQLYGEALFQANKVINRFITIIEDGTLTVEALTLRRLMRNVLGATSIPFHGEPAIGMQVMGLMETRNLDFSHLLMLNVGEGTMPKKSDDNSLIPFPLREAFGLTTFRHRISVFAYYFFRLLQRTEHVTLMYNENSSGVKNNEMSRFMRQLMAETDLPIRHIRLTPTNHPVEKTTEASAEKTPEMMEALRQKYSTSVLSPTAINTYLNCPLSFYYKYVAGMRISENPEDGITPAIMGDIFHNAAEEFAKEMWSRYGTHTLSAEMFPSLDKDKSQMEPYIDMKDYETSCGLPLIIKNVILEYLANLVKYDKLHAPTTIKEVEQDYFIDVNIAEEGKQPLMLKIGGRVDRLDSTEQGLKVVDYKTGGSPESIPSIEDIFKHEAKNAGYYFQTMLYSLAVSHKYGCGVKPTLFYVHHASNAKDYDASLVIKPSKGSPEVIEDVRAYEEEFMDRLKEKLRELFNPDICFSQTANEKKCTYCDYAKLCGKKVKR